MVLCQHCKEIFRSTRSLDAYLKASSHCQRAATAKLIEQSQELLLRAVASSRDNEDNGMHNQGSIANADESVAPSHESSVREQDYSDESMEEEAPGVECGESMEEETSGVESSDASSSRDSDTTMSSQTSRTLSDDVSSSNSMDAQPSESSMWGGGGASNYNAEADDDNDDDYDDDSLAGTNVESEAEEEDSMIMIEDFFFTEDDAMRLLCMLTLSLDTLLIASKYIEEELVELDSKI
jgi:hypothetical protein